jgi:hypothetical protein
MLNEGYRNIQLNDVYARTVEPPCNRLFRQVYLWSSSFLQSCYYYNDLLKSPMHALKRWRMRRQGPPQSGQAVSAPALSAMPALAGAGAGGGSTGAVSTVLRRTVTSPMVLAPAGAGAATSSDAAHGERRRVAEAFRQPFGRTHTKLHGRPAGWLLATAAVEKVFFPTALVIMLLLQHWEAFWVTVACESLIGLTALVLVTPGQRTEYFFKGVAVVPVRYALLISELVTLGRFATDLWITRNRKWRK